MIRKTLSEMDVCRMYINPVLEEAGWDLKKRLENKLLLLKVGK